MKTFSLTTVLGIIVGLIDILPMIKMKLDRYAIASAFTFYLILPFIILNIDLYGLAWWLKGGLVALLLAIPTMILIAKEDKKSVPPVVIMSVVLGTVIAAAGNYLIQ